MKTRFRITFDRRGWIVEYKNPLQAWTQTKNNTLTGTQCFSSRLEALKVCYSLKKGFAPANWYSDPKIPDLKGEKL